MTEAERTGTGVPVHPWTRDLLAGLAVAVVLVPQSLAYAELAGLPADRGLVTAAIAGTVGALLGSSPYLQTGPTALASLLTFGILAGVADVGGERFVALAAALAVMAGLVRIALALARLGRVSYLLSPPVIAGLASGAGVLIVASQVPALLGVTDGASNPLVGAARALVGGGWSGQALAVGAATLAVMVGCRRLGERVPAALLAIVTGILLAELVFDDVPAVTLSVPAIGIAVDQVTGGDLLHLLVPALVVGVIGFSEAASIARRLSVSRRRRWSANRELLGQGVACTLAGAAGGFPTSGSFSRSALAQMSGARTRLTGIVAGLAVVLVLPFTDVLPPIPRPALGALVIVAGVALIDPAPFARLRANTSLQFAVAVGTFVATLVLAPRIDIAVLIGVVLAIGAHLFREERVHVLVDRRGDTVHVTVDGVLFYVSAPRLTDALARVLADHHDVSRVVIDLTGAGRIDVSGAVALGDALDEFEETGASVQVLGMSPVTEKILRRVLGDRLAPDAGVNRSPSAS